MKESLSDFLVPVREIVHHATGLPLNRVLVPRQDKPKPKGDCAFVLLTIEQAIGMPYKADRLVPAENTTLTNHYDIERTLIQKARIRATCNFFGPSARENVQKILRCNYLNTVAKTLFDHGIGWRRVTSPIDLTLPVEGHTEERYQIEIMLVVDIGAIPFMLEIGDSIKHTISDDRGNPIIE